MFRTTRFDPMRFSLAIAAVLAVVALAIAAAPAWADEPMEAEDIEVPPAAEPAPAPAPARVQPARAPAPAPMDEDAFFLYVSGNVGGSFAEGDSSGFNTAGGFPNRGDDDDETVFGGGALGIGWKASDVVGVRVELEGEAARGYDFETNSIGPPLNYRTDVQAWNMMGNIWLDFPITEMFSVYAGGGLGFAVSDIRATDGVVFGDSTDDTTFAWQAGAGLSVELTDWLALDTSYRYIDLGQPDLNFNFGNGDYELDVTSHDIVMGVRFNFMSF